MWSVFVCVLVCVLVCVCVCVCVCMCMCVLSSDLPERVKELLQFIESGAFWEALLKRWDKCALSTQYM